MISYKLKRRAFLAALGGGVGLKIMFRNLELAAQTASSPPRLLVTHWPLGIVAGQSESLWRPTSGSVGSPALQPFADAGLGADMTVMRGIRLTGFPRVGCMSGHQAGTVLMTTGVNIIGCRSNPDADDAVADGPSFDQVFLRNVPSLQAPGGSGYANAICDGRTDFVEVSTQTLSYSHTKQSVMLRDGTTVEQAMPILSVLSPLQQYASLFGSFVPCGAGGAGMAGSGATGAGTAGTGAGGAPNVVAPELLKQLAHDKSVLDFALEEIAQMKTMVPADARDRLDIHAQAIREMEQSIRGSIDAFGPAPTAGAAGAMGGGAGGMGGGAGGMGGSGGCNSLCVRPTAPPNVVGKSGAVGSQYGTGRDLGTSDDGPLLQQVAGLHLDVLRAAMACDLIRVATFQYCPGQNHVSFKGLYPGDPSGFYQHHPVSHRIGTVETVAASTVAGLSANAGFLFNAMVWFFARHAENMLRWKNQLDAFGNGLLDHTVVPFFTEVQATAHEWSNMPAMIIGGKRLGFIHGQYVSGSFTPNDYWGTIGQAFGYTNMAPVGAPIAGIWRAPT